MGFFALIGYLLVCAIAWFAIERFLIPALDRELALASGDAVIHYLPRVPERAESNAS